MTHHYLTLFDTTYAVKGALMLESLARRSGEPHEVTVIALDDVAARVAAACPGVAVTPLAALEAAVPGLAAARAARTWREYCWTLASVALRWRLAQLAPGDVLTYLDADLGFFSDPAACHAELGDRSIGIVLHNFAEAAEGRIESSGLFNVSWVSMRNDEAGRACAVDWAGCVLARCAETDCGDQRYLSAWPARYGAALHVFASPGIGVAPWNVFGYRVENGHAVTVNEHPVVFYHYHELQPPSGNAPTGHGFECKPDVCHRTLLFLDGFQLTIGYPLRPVDIDAFYRPYLARYRARAAELAC